MRPTNFLLGLFNLVTTLLSIPVIAVGIWLARKHDTDCVRFLQWPVIIIGVLILLVSLLGLVGSCRRIASLLWIYSAILFILIVLLFAFTIFAFVVTNHGAGDAVSGKGFKEYRLGNYSTWLQKRVNNAKNWKKIRSCLSDAKVCKDLDDKYPTATTFNQSDLSPTQSGCCKPPTSCGFQFLNATDWINPANPNADQDCQTWNNNSTQLCFDCNSCRAGVLQNVKRDWRKVAIVNIVILVALLIVYSTGCCAFRNARREGMYDNSYPYNRKGYA